MIEGPAIEVTSQAQALIQQLAGQHGPLMFHLSGGCCDGSAPMCYPAGEFRVGSSDVLVGAVAGYPLYMGAAQHATWKHTRLIVDAVPGRGSGFSLEAPLGMRFLIRSELAI
jgi:uncharacterized protein (DUF779 family)